MEEFTEIPSHFLDQVLERKFDNFRAYVNKNNITNLNLSEKVKNCNLKLIGEALQGTKIKGINLSFNGINAQGAKDFGKALKKTNVTYIDLSANKICAQGAKDFGKALKKTKVTHVDLSSNNIGDQGVKDFGDALKNTMVLHVNFSDNRITDQGAKDFGKTLNAGTKLNVVNFSRNYIGDQGVKDLGGSLKDTVITHLNLDCNKIGHEGMRYLADSLKANTQITHIDLSNNNCGTAAKYFGNALKDTQVTYLGFKGNNINKQALEEFVATLKDNKKLTDLDLSANNIKEVNYLGKILKDTLIKYLNLNCNRIRDIKDFGENLKGTLIISIDLRYNNFKYQDAEDFAKCIPDTLILNAKIFNELERYTFEAVQSNVAKYIHTPYYLIALKLLPEDEKRKFKDIKKESLATKEGQLKYACGILMNPALPQDIFNLIYSLLPLASKKKEIISTYLTLAKSYHPNGLVMEQVPRINQLQDTLADLPLMESEQEETHRAVLNQYRLQSENKTIHPQQSILEENLQMHRNLTF